jgi:PAS domain S-box-containing protein
MSTIIIVTLWTAAATLAVLAFSVWRQSRFERPIATTVVILLVGGVWWCVGYLLEISITDPTLKLIAYRSKFLGIVIIPVAWLVFAMYYTGRDAWLSRRTLLGLAIIPVITLSLAWSNELHHWMWQQNMLADAGDFFIYDSIPAFWFWVHTVYTYITLTTGTLLLFRQFTEATGQYRRQIGVLLISVLFPYISGTISVFGTTLLDLAPIAFAITGTALGWGFLRYHLFDLIPVAQAVVIQGMPDGMIVLDRAKRIVDLNPTAVTLIGQSADAILGLPLQQAMPSLATYPETVSPRHSAAPAQAEVVIENSQGVRYLDLRVSNLQDSSGEVSGYVLVFHDISERKRAEQQIQAQNAALLTSNAELAIARQKAEEVAQLKSQFLATMSHELRTPLNAIIGYTEIQLEGMTGALNSEQQDYQQRILINAEHLLGLINGVLDLSKIEAGQMALAMKPFALRPWVRDLEMQNRGLAEAKGLHFEVTLDPTLPEVIVGDGIRLKQIAINLVGNAIKFTDTGTVSVALTAHDEAHWQLTVSDSGIGIAAHAQAVIFDEFWQVDRTSRRNHGGTGLGLSIARRLVLMMGGTIRVKSEVGKGSTFTVVLPYQKQGEAVPAFAM